MFAFNVFKCFVHSTWTWIWVLAFFLAYLGALWWVQAKARQRPAKKEAPLRLRPRELIKTEEPLDPLGWEYQYARITASEAMRDRHTTINFYLLVVGVAATGLLGLSRKELLLPLYIAGALAWVVCCLGAFYFLILVKLREAWFESALHLLQVRDFSVGHTAGLPNTTLNRSDNVRPGAFRWHSETLPDKQKRWTVFYYSAMLIAFLNGVCYFLGAALIASHYNSVSWCKLLGFAGLAVAFFGFHDKLYGKLLTDRKPKPVPKTPEGSP